MQVEEQFQGSAALDNFYCIQPEVDLDSIYSSGKLPEVLRHTLERGFSWQRRNETTLERTLNMPGLAPLWVGGLLAGGTLVVVNDKSIPLEEVLQLSTKQSYQKVCLPIRGLVWGEAQVARTPVDEPIVSAIAAVKIVQGVVMQVKVALTGVWPHSVGLVHAVDGLIGGPLSQEQIVAVSAKVADEVEPKADFLGSVEYRREMAVVLTRHALEMCLKEMN